MNTETPYAINSPEEIADQLAEKIRALRLSRKWKQSTLATRSGVSLPSLRRFEQSGQISLKSLLCLAFTLGRLDEFASILQPPAATSIRELEAVSTPHQTKRGSK